MGNHIASREPWSWLITWQKGHVQIQNQFNIVHVLHADGPITKPSQSTSHYCTTHTTCKKTNTMLRLVGKHAKKYGIGNDEIKFFLQWNINLMKAWPNSIIVSSNKGCRFFHGWTINDRGKIQSDSRSNILYGSIPYEKWRVMNFQFNHFGKIIMPLKSTYYNISKMD